MPVDLGKADALQCRFGALERVPRATPATISGSAMFCSTLRSSKEHRVVQHQANRAPQQRQSAPAYPKKRLAGDGDLALGWRLERRDQAQHSGLSGAGRAQQ